MRPASEDGPPHVCEHDWLLRAHRNSSSCFVLGSSYGEQNGGCACAARDWKVATRADHRADIAVGMCDAARHSIADSVICRDRADRLIVWPNLSEATLAIAGDRYSERAGTVFGLLISIALMGGMLLPWTVGQVSQRLSLRAGMMSHRSGRLALSCCQPLCFCAIKRGADFLVRRSVFLDELESVYVQTDKDLRGLRSSG